MMKSTRITIRLILMAISVAAISVIWIYAGWQVAVSLFVILWVAELTKTLNEDFK